MTSKNERARKICGERDFGGIGIYLDEPYELGYRCPKCGEKNTLTWSEYETFIWCENCNLDIPSCMCKENIEEGIDVYLDCVEEFIKGRKNEMFKM